MRKLNYLIILILVIGKINIFGQIDYGGMPYSLRQTALKSSTDLVSFNASKLNISKLKEEDKGKLPLRYAVFEEVDIDIRTEGTSENVSDGKIWMYKISSPNAKSLNLVFNTFNIPEGAKVFVYNSGEVVYGAFTKENNKDGGTFTIRDMPGNELTIEYFEPSRASFKGEILLGEIGKAYRDISNDEEISEEDVSLIDINCTEGDRSQLIKHAVARMAFGGYLCSGALINNLNNDGTPYFLTAHHCISDQTYADELITYFNYEYNDCDGGSASLSQSLSGATLLATSDASDYTLLLLDETPPASYMPYYAGWDAQTDSLLVGAYGVHHPGGAAKKVSVEYGEVTTYPSELNWDEGESTPANTHWLVTFDEGQTQGGSSGSPLFDKNGRIVGQLHGGDDDGTYDFYGKLSTSWTLKDGDLESLSYYLDPDNENTLILDGYYPDSNYVDAFPYVEYANVCVGEQVKLKDGSLFDPTSWTWSIIPTSYEFVEGTSSSDQNPVVVFNEKTSYNISLTVSDGITSDKQTRRSYISTEGLDLRITPIHYNSACVGDFEFVKYAVAGADSFKYELVTGQDIAVLETSEEANDTVVIRLQDDVVLDTTVDITLKVTGIMGQCESSDSTIFSIFFQTNDSISNALGLEYGENGPFNNTCGSAEENEPYPTIGDCSTEGEWCDCETSGTSYVNNSLWFTFQGTETGYVTIDCPGFDNQIAVYKAAADIMSGDESNYQIIAAIDDYYDEEGEFAAKVINVEVEDGTTYWLQVDGSACGTTGVFYVNLSNEYVVSTKEDSQSPTSISVLPNPTNGYFELSTGKDADILSGQLYSLEGKLIYDYTFSTGNGGVVKDYLPEYIKSGFYILKVSDKNKKYSLKLLVNR
jgi:hypothetical protein